MVKRFVLFGGYAYYASGGMHDFVSSFDTLDEARDRAIFLEKSDPHGRIEFEWWHIFDLESRVVVEASEYPAYGPEDAMPSLRERFTIQESHSPDSTPTA